ncbi:MAG: tetratricopeptide repeat protein [Thermodesulfovibrionales bacterium]|nr:tetratricopeptide repeat protein [Thermodesulfovibrionales bacterium]
MKKEDSIKIKTLLHKDVSTTITIDGNKYLILTDDLAPKNQRISTKVYLGGKILFTRDLDLKEFTGAPAAGKKLLGLIHRQHEMIIEILREESLKKAKTPSDYLDEVKILLQKKNNRRALDLLNAALLEYPDEPFLLSYYGCLEAVINKNLAYGIDTCKQALDMLNDRSPVSKEIFFPTFYLNLGRAYIAAGKKQDAIEAFQKGLSYDEENKDLLWEARKLGMRKNPVIPYLKRTNPINKYIGMILHKLGKST